MREMGALPARRVVGGVPGSSPSGIPNPEVACSKIGEGPSPSFPMDPLRVFFIKGAQKRREFDKKRSYALDNTCKEVLK